MANEPKVKVPDGFRAEFVGRTPIVRCWRCEQCWRVPEAMYRTGLLSPNAWTLLLNHRQSHPTPATGRLRPETRAMLPRTGGYGEVG